LPAATDGYDGVVGIFCFDAIATERGIAWDRLVILWSVSGVTARRGGRVLPRPGRRSRSQAARRVLVEADPGGLPPGRCASSG